MPNQNPTVDSQSNYYGSPIISVIVGTGLDSVTFNVHRDLICAESKYFATACSEPWLVENRVSLSEDDPVIFKRLLDWLYSNMYADYTGEPPVDTEIRSHLLLGVLADKLQVPRLILHMGNWIDKELKSNMNVSKTGFFGITGHEAQYVYENTLPFSRLRGSLTRMIAKDIIVYDEDYWQVAMKGDSEFAFDLATALRRRLASPQSLQDNHVQTW
ncbi:hypothetical protein MMC27_001583 [Xylographa pallens]|nr:hypothetical protein [Xylographa pallens]